MFCESFLEIYPIKLGVVGGELGLMKLILGICYFSSAVITVLWLRLLEKQNFHRVESAIFPAFIKLVWLSLLGNAYVGILIIFVPVTINQNNSIQACVLYALAWALQHFAIEGIAFMFMQKGVGFYAAKTATKKAAYFSIFTFVIELIVYANLGYISVACQFLWEVILIIFYLMLWQLPRRKLFRRPAAIIYGRFWCCYRVLNLIFFIFIAADNNSVIYELGWCGRDFISLYGYCVVHPFITYWSLLQDSRWWQGLEIHQGAIRYQEDVQITSPLGGTDISLVSAQALATSLDSLDNTQKSKLLNFADVKLNKSKVLGQGSFSKVYRGYYKQTEVAIKLLYSLDLTEDMLERVMTEANILSTINHPNVVHIYGVAVFPPSVCLVLELCHYGSLADILHISNANGYLSLSTQDKLFLALGCIGGVNAIHQFQSKTVRRMVHRDIKSFNFLIDRQLNVKLADLELGNQDLVTPIDERDVYEEISKDILINWCPPEILSRRSNYSQASDIYSLSLVLWEIFSGVIPFETSDASKQKSNHTYLKAKIVQGLRPLIDDWPERYRDMIVAGWSDDETKRPTASDMYSTVSSILSDHLSSGLECLQDTSVLDICNSLNSFLSTTVGVQYVKQIFLTALSPSDSTLSISQPYKRASFFVRRSVSDYSKSSLAITNAGSYGEGSLLSEIDKSSFSGSSAARPSRPSGLPENLVPDRLSSFLHNRNSTLEVDSASASNFSSASFEISVRMGVQSLYSMVHNNKSFLALSADRIDEPFVVLSGQFPHVILQCNALWSEMVGTSIENAFGYTLHRFVDVSRESIVDVSKPSEGALSTTSLSPSAVITLNNFLDSIKLNEPYAHCVLEMQIESKLLLSNVPMSLYGVPVSRDFKGSEVTLTMDRNSNGSGGRSGSGNESVKGIASEDQSLLLILVYMNPLKKVISNPRSSSVYDSSVDSRDVSIVNYSPFAINNKNVIPNRYSQSSAASSSSSVRPSFRGSTNLQVRSSLENIEENNI